MESNSRNILMTGDESSSSIYVVSGNRRKMTFQKEKCKSIAVISSVVVILILLVVGVYFSVIYHTSMNPSVDWLHVKCPVPGTPVCPDSFKQSPVILVSLDGFRANYLLRKLTPILEHMQECGSHVPYMRAAYPTKTFVNHYTIVTGLFPESHGIVDNNMYDPAIGKYPFISTIPQTFQNSKWWKGQPIWNTVRLAKKISATYFWPGSDVEIGGIRPNIYEKYNESVPFKHRVDQVLKWLDFPVDKRPDLITLYFNQPDRAAHDTGTNSRLVNEKLREVDEMIGRLMDGLYKRNLHHCANIIVLADHGMKTTPCTNIVSLDQYIDPEGIFVFEGASGRINNNHSLSNNTVIPSKHPQSVEKLLSELKCKNDHYDAYRKEDFPKRLHYANSARIDEILLDVEDGWQVYKKNGTCGGGGHGYDNIYNSMHALFIAHGPDFKQKVEFKPFLNIEVYNLLTDLLNITAAENNGTNGALHHLLVNPPVLPDRPNGSTYLDSKFPSTQKEYESRSSMSACSCKNYNVTILDERLNISDYESNSYQQRHLPFGRPVLLVNDTISILSHSNYITAFSEERYSPIWTSFTLKGRPGKIPDLNDSLPCLRPDVRSPVFNLTQTCEYYKKQNNYSVGLLYQPGVDESYNDTESMDAYILSNSIPMLVGFKSGIWSYLMGLVEKWQKLNSQVNIVTGPIYDYNVDGLRDDMSQIPDDSFFGLVPIPTHYFLVATKCTELNDGKCEVYDSAAFILPHKSEQVVCKLFQSEERYLFINAARVKDVELLSGLLFYPDLPRYEALRLQNFLLNNIWPQQ